jgi:hypothetical protein
MTRQETREQLATVARRIAHGSLSTKGLNACPAHIPLSSPTDILKSQLERKHGDKHKNRKSLTFTHEYILYATNNTNVLSFNPIFMPCAGDLNRHIQWRSNA